MESLVQSHTGNINHISVSLMYLYNLQKVICPLDRINKIISRYHITLHLQYNQITPRSKNWSDLKVNFNIISDYILRILSRLTFCILPYIGARWVIECHIVKTSEKCIMQLELSKGRNCTKTFTKHLQKLGTMLSVRFCEL